MKTKASLFGHPLHAMLIPVPIGALVTALVFNVAHLWTGDPAFYRGAALATVFGAASLLVAIAPGLVDYFASVPRRGEVRAHAGVHMVLGLALTGYFVMSGVMHWLTAPSPGPTAAWSAFGINAVGAIGLAFQGYLGGGLITTHQLGVETGYLQELPPPSHEAPVRDDEPERRTRGQLGGGGSP